MARIVHVSETLATGVLSVICTLMAEQVRDGHEVVLIGSSARADTPSDWRARLPASVQVVDFQMPQAIGLADLRCAWALRGHFRALRPDAVHLHSSKAGAVGRLAHLGMRGTVIYQPHGFAFMRSDVSATHQFIFGCIEAALAMLPGKVVACSQGEADASRRFLAWRQVHVVPNGISLPHVARTAGADWQEKGRLPVVVTCGRISPQKAPAFFADLARQMAGRCEFRWIGGGDFPEGEQALRAAGVQLLGWRTREQVLADLHAADFYVQTSAWEGMPVAVMEAMACALPTVVTNIAGNRDLIAPIDPGSVVDSPAAMAQRLSHWLKHPDEAREMGLRMQHQVMRHHTAKAMSGRYAVLYGVCAA